MNGTTLLFFEIKKFAFALRHLIFIIVLLPNGASAGSFSVVPVRVYMQESQPVASLEVTNGAEHAVMIQSDTRSWSQLNGKPVLQETSELIVSPPIFELAAGSSQTIRLAIRHDSPLDRERTFRLFLKEVPLSSTISGVGVQINLRLSLPVFLSPANAKSNLQWTILSDCGDGPKLQAYNTGSKHQQVVKLSLVTSKDKSVVEQLLRSKYVLAGAKMDWPLLSDPSDWPDKLLAQVETEQGALHQSKVIHSNENCDVAQRDVHE